MTEIKAKQRDKSIDIAKGIGIILVVYGHLACPIRREIFLFHMPLFFLLSGYFFSSRDSIKIFLVKKTKSLLLPFCLFYILSSIFKYFWENYGDLINYIKSFGEFLAPDPPLWFLLSLFEIFVIFFIIEKYIYSGILKLMIVCGITLIGYLCAMNEIFLFYFPQSCLGYIFFYIGYQIKQYNILQNRKVYLYVIIGAIVSYCLGIVLRVHTDMKPLEIDSTYILFFLPALGGSLLVIYFSRYLQDKRYTSWLAYLGRNSLLVMCVHMPLIPLSNLLALPVLKVIYHFMGNTTMTDIEMMGGRICGLLSFIVLVPLSLYIGLLIKKIFPFCFSK